MLYTIENISGVGIDWLFHLDIWSNSVISQSITLAHIFKKAGHRSPCINFPEFFFQSFGNGAGSLSVGKIALFWY